MWGGLAVTQWLTHHESELSVTPVTRGRGMLTIMLLLATRWGQSGNAVTPHISPSAALITPSVHGILPGNKTLYLIWIGEGKPLDRRALVSRSCQVRVVFVSPMSGSGLWLVKRIQSWVLIGCAHPLPWHDWSRSLVTSITMKRSHVIHFPNMKQRVLQESNHH